MDALPLFEAEDHDDQHCSSSSIGNNSDVSSETESGEDSNEAHSSYKCDEPFDSMDSLQQLLPIRRGISKFYDGKSKSFTSLADAGCSPSVKDIAKPENAYTRRRRNLMAFNHIWDKNRNLPPRSNSGGICKRTISSGRNAAALAFAISYDSSSSCASEDSSSSSNPMSPPPLPSSSMKQSFSAWRSYSLVDIQNCGTAVTTIKMPSSSMENEAAYPSQ